MADRTGVMNQALIRLGVETITSENDENEPARVMRACFDDHVKAELRAYPWSFAKARAQLAALSAAPDFGYDVAYQLPADFLRVIQINDFYEFVDHTYDQEDVPYEIEGRQLLTNYEAPLKIRYIKDLTADPSSWDALFVRACSISLAALTCKTLTKSTSDKISLDKEYLAVISLARRVDAIERPPSVTPDGTFITRRP